jgi:GT2 family glycosyltransferase
LFNKAKEYCNKILQIVRERGFKTALRMIQSKLQTRHQRAPRVVTVQDWLLYYQDRAEIRQQSGKNFVEYPKISILVLTYNNLLINQLCLASIYCNTTYPNFEVIVVDNASIDETPGWLKIFATTHPNLKLFLNTDNCGFSGGNNQAVREATGEYLIFLNNDTVVTPGWVERLLTHMQGDPKIGLVGPVTNSTGNEARIPVNYNSPVEMEIFAADLANGMSGRSFDIRMLAFYCVMARKDQYETIGGLDERFLVGMFEDDDLAVRYHQSGFRVVCAEDVFIHHFQGAAFGKLDNDRYTRLFEDNKRKYEEKWGRDWQPYQTRLGPPSQMSKAKLFIPPQSWEMISFKCNVCGRSCKSRVIDLEREKPSCRCGSTVRIRAVVHLLSIELFGNSMALPDFPMRPDLHGWGMSSDEIYADLLSKKVGFLNTFYHKKPRLDINAPLDPSVIGSLDFLISTDVFEHVPPPVSRGFKNAHRLLKSKGVLILTVPYSLESETIEHFPELYEYEIVQTGKPHPLLKNITRDGREQVFDNLTFHGGPGTVLEMRIFSEAGLLDELKEAGFSSIKICSEPFWEFGIYWRESWSLPIIARSAPITKDEESEV